MPPVSVTMHALNLAAAAGALLDAVLDGVLDELEPHAAASRETALIPATIPNLPLTVTSFARGGRRPPGRAAGSIARPQPARARKSRSPPWISRRLAPDAPVREA